MATGNMPRSLVKFDRVVFVSCERTDRHSSQYFAFLPGGGRSNYESKIDKCELAGEL